MVEEEVKAEKDVKDEPAWRVIGSYFLIFAAHLAVWILAIGSFFGIPYWLIHHWSEVNQYFCGASCGRAGNVVLVVSAVLATSAITSMVLSTGIMLGMLFKKRMEQIGDFVAKNGG